MSDRAREELLDIAGAFDHPVTVGVTIGLASVLAVTPLVVEALRAAGRIGPDLRREIYVRYRSWLVLMPVMVVPLLIGRGPAIAAITLLSLFCYAEFARATGAFRSRSISAIVAVGILMLGFAALDHWYGLFVALPSMTIVLIAVIAVAGDRPQGYIQRVALGALGYLLFGFCLGHLAYMANAEDFRPLILVTLLCVEGNDILAFICGKAFGRRKLIPNTSPNKTIGGAVGALVLTTTLLVTVGYFVFDESPMSDPLALLGLGVMISVAGQFGDLVISAIKRDLGLKDMGAAIPGHGGVLDRFDSAILVAPLVFHYVGFFQGIGLERAARIFTGF